MEIGKILDNGRLSLNRRNKGKPYSISISVEGVVSTITEILLTKQNLIKLYEMIKQEIVTEPVEWKMKNEIEKAIETKIYKKIQK